MTAMVLGLIAAGLVSGQEASETSKPNAKPPKPRFTISKETTFVTGPVDAAGYIDFEAALNERLRQGTTPANNANVLLWRAFGPKPERANMPGTFFHWQGVLPPPEEGEYYIGYYQYLRERLHIIPQSDAEKLLVEKFESANERPWKAKQYPPVAAWLKVNERSLAVVLEATKRSSYYSPLVTKKGDPLSQGLIGALLPGVQKCREFAFGLSARAMLHVGEGRFDDAWQDLLALHRLARHVARGGTLIEGLVGRAIENIASEADLWLLDNKAVEAKRLRGYLRELQQLPAIPSFADQVDLTERILHLEILVLIERLGLPYVERNFTQVFGNLPDKAKEFLNQVDWNVAMREANGWFDRRSAAMRVPDRTAREKKMEAAEKEIQAVKKALLDSGKFAKALAGDEKMTAAAKGKMLSDAIFLLLSPAVSKVQSSSDRLEQIHRNLKVAFALGIYEREEGRYPMKLDALTPKYLDKLPDDLYTGQPLVYRPEGKGYVLYSIGANGVDDQGRYFNDDPPGDDPRVRLPLPKPKQK